MVIKTEAELTAYREAVLVEVGMAFTPPSFPIPYEASELWLAHVTRRAHAMADAHAALRDSRDSDLTEN